MQTNERNEKQLVKADEVKRILNVESSARVYELAREIFPPGVVVRLGRQVRFDREALSEWIAHGGSIADHAVRKAA